MPLVETIEEDITGSIDNDGFFPSFSLETFNENYKVPDYAEAPFIRQQVLNAILKVNRQLCKIKTEALAAGINTLAEVEADSIEQTSVKVIDYIEAVSLRAKFLVFNELKTVARKDSAENMAKDKGEAVEYLVVHSNEAVRRIKGVSRQGYESI